MALSDGSRYPLPARSEQRVVSVRTIVSYFSKTRLSVYSRLERLISKLVTLSRRERTLISSRMLLVRWCVEGCGCAREDGLGQSERGSTICN